MASNPPYTQGPNDERVLIYLMDLLQWREWLQQSIYEVDLEVGRLYRLARNDTNRDSPLWSAHVNLCVTVQRLRNMEHGVEAYLDWMRRLGYRF
jgi:hypothetical protein